MMSLYVYIRTRLQSLQLEEGQDLVEYALLLGLISIVAIAAIIFAGESVSQLWDAVSTALGLATAAIP